jgi:CBS domain-containing protein
MSLSKTEHLMKKSNEVMTKNPFCCLPDDMVIKAALLMKSKEIGAIPVIESEETNKLVGIVTDRDLALEVVAEGRDPQTTKVGDVMSGKVVTCRADEDVRKALDGMSKHQLRRIPVVDKNNRLVGIIAQADVATRVNDAGKTAALVKGISQ